jgi:hypothetical protein
MKCAVAELLPKIRAGFGAHACMAACPGPEGDPDEIPIEEALDILEKNPDAATVSELQWVGEDSASGKQLGSDISP